MRRAMAIAAILAVLGGLPAAEAAQWPTKPVTVIVPWAAGGMTDITTRLLAERFKDKLGQPVAVSNVGGAGGITGMRAIMAARPDGYTFGSGAISSAFSSPFFLDTPPLDLKKVDFIGAYAFQERIIFAPLGKPYKTWAEFVDYARKNPGSVSIGFGGAQQALEVAKSLMKKEGLKVKLVMFKTGGEASSAMLGGHIDLVETGSGTPAYQAAREGKLIPLIDLGNARDPHFTQLKNMPDHGVQFTATSDYGMVVPAGVPEEIRAKLENALKVTLEEPAVKETIFTMGLERKFIPGRDYRPVVAGVVESVPKLADYVKDYQ